MLSILTSLKFCRLVEFMVFFSQGKHYDQNRPSCTDEITEHVKNLHRGPNECISMKSVKLSRISEASSMQGLRTDWRLVPITQSG